MGLHGLIGDIVCFIRYILQKYFIAKIISPKVHGSSADCTVEIGHKESKYNTKVKGIINGKITIQ
jgi:hypothetical protein